jgi:DNA invertase Pin-like site-specific DNA recombinase
MKYGYARVSTDGQSVTTQVEQLTRAGAEKVFREKISGAITHRQQLKRVLDALDVGDTWADTTTPHGRLMLTVLAGLAEFERDLIRARTGEGRERAKARGVKLGPKFKLTPHQCKEALARKDSGKESQTEIARSYNVSHSTISRLSA